MSVLVVLDVWPCVASFCTYADILTSLLLLNSRITKKLKSANVDLWMQVADSLIQQYMKKRGAKPNPHFLLNYTKRNLHQRVDWARECRTIYQHTIAELYIIWMKSNGFYFYRTVNGWRVIDEHMITLSPAVSKWYFFEYAGQQQQQQQQQPLNKWKLTRANGPLPDSGLDFIMTYLQVPDEQEVRQRMLGFCMEINQWCFETGAWDNDEFDPIACRRCLRIYTPCTVMTRMQMCCL